MDGFFVENGSKILMFFYGDDVNAKTKPAKFRVQIVDSSNLSLRGVCLFFFRNSTSIAITPQNIHQVGLSFLI